MIGWAVAAVVLIAVGLPLIAVTASRRLPAPRPRPVEGDAVWRLSREYGLSGKDFFDVENAVRTGQAAPERLRPAAHAFAEHALTLNDLGRPRPGRRTSRRARLAAIAVLLAVLAFSVAHHYWGAVFDVVLYLVVFPFVLRSVARTRRSRAQAALDANAPVAE